VTAFDVSVFEHEGILFDQNKGIGQVPFVTDISYFGCVVFMTPTVFFDLCAPGLRPENHLLDIISGGSPVSMGFLRIDPDERGDYRVAGHEGRHRMDALRTLRGDVPFPVALTFGSSVRARNLTEEMLATVSEGVRSEACEGRPYPSVVPGPLFDRFVLRGQLHEIEPKHGLAF
jgi:hypothetical protein